MFVNWTKYKPQVLIELYSKMFLCRCFEETMYYLFLQGKVPGTLHQSQGQEAVSVGVCSILNKDDVIFSTHRPHSDYISKGADLVKLTAEILGRKGGCCKGKGGSMHITDVSVGAMPANAIVGGNVPIAVGSGLAFKLKESKQVSVSFFGDGAINEGAWHEALNFAALFDIPVIFICVNNQFASSTHVKQSVKIDQLADRADAYGIPGIVVDGMDVLAVREAMKEAVDRARSGGGPTLLENICYRLVGHSRSDPANYRSEEEYEKWQKRDPIKLLRKELINKGVLDEAGIKKVEEEVQKQMDLAVEMADKSPDPDPKECLDDVYA
jgi:TPP-dependent pyruvate/acetoin dehydrogenase alpha subunit